MKKITIKEIVEEAGVSNTTLSRFLNNNYGNMSKETKEKIVEVIERLNYRSSKQTQALKIKHSYLNDKSYHNRSIVVALFFLFKLFTYALLSFIKNSMHLWLYCFPRGHTSSS